MLCKAAMENKKHKLSNPIPVDLLIEIFLKVPSKSIARFRCVSKLWRSILGRQDFTDLFLTKSLAHPQLLFILEDGKEFFVFSSPQPRNPDENLSVVATPYSKYVSPDTYTKSDMVCGLIFRQSIPDAEERVICNYATREFLTLPPEAKEVSSETLFFGYDPIDKKFKVLCMTWSNTHRVLTLENGKRVWREIESEFCYEEGCISRGEICIDGVLYFGGSFQGSCGVVYFAVRSEKFSFVKIDIDMLKYIRPITLMNYKGKLGAYGRVNKNGECLFGLWVLEDAGNHKWSEYIYEYPRLPVHGWDFDGMTIAGEMVFTPFRPPSDFFYIFFYNLERKKLTSIDIQGFEEFKHRNIYIITSLDYVENIKLYK